MPRSGMSQGGSVPRNVENCWQEAALPPEPDPIRPQDDLNLSATERRRAARLEFHEQCKKPGKIDKPFGLSVPNLDTIDPEKSTSPETGQTSESLS